VVYGGHALGTTPGGHILEFTHVGGPAPSFASGHGQAFHPKNLRPAAYDELTLRTALIGHFHPGNLEFTHIKRLTPASNFCPGQALHHGSLDPMAGPCPEQRLHHQQDVAAQGAHERWNHPPPRGPVTSNNAAVWHPALWGQDQSQGQTTRAGLAVRHTHEACQLPHGSARLRVCGPPEDAPCHIMQTVPHHVQSPHSQF